MARYLLSTQAFVNLAKRIEAEPVKLWANHLDRNVDELNVSVISIGQVQSKINTLKNDDIKLIWQAHFDDAIRILSSHIIEIDHAIAKRWADLRNLELITQNGNAKLNKKKSKKKKSMIISDEVGKDTRLILASALEKNLILVDTKQPYHESLLKFGLQLIDPRTDVEHE